MKTLLSKFLIYMLFTLALMVSAHSIGLPKIGGNSGSGGGNVDELKLKFTKVFYESSLEYMEAQAYLFDALDMNDEASKTRKSIEFVKNDKNKEGKRLTNA